MIASIGAFSAGTVLGWSSPANKLTATNSYEFTASPMEMSWLGSVIGLGAAAICLIGGTMIDIVGRKITMLLMLIPFTIGWFLIIFAQNMTFMITGRVFLGVACGGICVSAPVSLPNLNNTFQ